MKWIKYAGVAMGISSAPLLAGQRVVFVHGIFEEGKSFVWMKKKFEAQGCECMVPSLKPADARSGLETLAEQLKREVDAKWGADSQIHIVAHSMGGLVSRYYLQELGGHQRCVTFTTLATPHHGTLAAHLYPGKGAFQMRPGSEFLKKLEDGQNRLKHVSVASYRTPFDLIILPSTSSEWNIAENRVVWAPAHPLVMHTPRVQKEILQNIQTYSGQTAK
jgi:triacylglycerol lipase